MAETEALLPYQPGPRGSSHIAAGKSRDGSVPVHTQFDHYHEQPAYPSNGGARKRTYSDAHVDPAMQWRTTQSSASSSESSLTPPPSEVEGQPGIKAPKVKRSRGNSTSASQTKAVGKSSGRKRQNSRKKIEADAFPDDQDRVNVSGGKGKEKTIPSDRDKNPEVANEPVDASITKRLGLGVAVIPINSGISPIVDEHNKLRPAILTMHQSVELQSARCMSAKYNSDPKLCCLSCTRRWAGDTCRFQHIRVFIRDAFHNLIGFGFQPIEAGIDAKVPEVPLEFPEVWNVALERRHIDRTMNTVAKALLSHLRREQQHQSKPYVVKRIRETDVRAVCDTCMTSLFSNTWMCRLCGREACEECFSKIASLSKPSSTPQPAKPLTDPAAQRALRKRQQEEHHFLTCIRRHNHYESSFVPITRFNKSELDKAVAEMEDLVSSSDSKAAGSTHSNLRDTDSTSDSTSSQPLISSPTAEKGLDAIHDDGVCKLIHDPTPPTCDDDTTSPFSTALPPSHKATLPTWPIPYYSIDSLTECVFAARWARGCPLVVSGCLSKMTLAWTPEYFMDKYGSQPCIILECQTDANKRITVTEFFSAFGKYEGRTECLKLKDWPPSSDFKSTFPELYEQFNLGVPVPSYCRRDGAMNIASHFPKPVIAPDLGPKMYNAYAARDDAGGKGSTRLHMDMADAVNIMVHTEKTKDGNPGCAAWDIYRAEDADAIRRFLGTHFRGKFQNDPIHAQQFFLDSELREKLYQETGVRSFRIYQRPGDAVFIPAGCAHQVCNYADCIKVACDFVSPENVERCEILTNEFREQNQQQVWKEDVLQLRAMMWFAWMSCLKQQRARSYDKDGRDAVDALNTKQENTHTSLPTSA